MNKDVLIEKLYKLMNATMTCSIDSNEAKVCANDIFLYLNIADNVEKCNQVFLSYKTISKDLIAPDNIDFKNQAINYWFEFIKNIIK